MQRLTKFDLDSLRISIRILRWHKGKKHPIHRRLRRSVAPNGSWILTAALRGGALNVGILGRTSTRPLLFSVLVLLSQTNLPMRAAAAKYCKKNDCADDRDEKRAQAV
jgi:hypothetical protein